jgi:hypothetical protein
VTNAYRTRYPHVFSKGRGVGFVGQGSRRGGPRGPGFPDQDGPANPCLIQTQSLALPASALSSHGGHAMTPAARELRRLSLKDLLPTVAQIYRHNMGLVVICTHCRHAAVHRNPALPDHFKRQWRMTLLDMETRCRCEGCGTRRARVYPWVGVEEG